MLELASAYRKQNYNIVTKDKILLTIEPQQDQARFIRKISTKILECPTQVVVLFLIRGCFFLTFSTP